MLSCSLDSSVEDAFQHECPPSLLLLNLLYIQVMQVSPAGKINMNYGQRKFDTPLHKVGAYHQLGFQLMAALFDCRALQQQRPYGYDLFEIHLVRHTEAYFLTPW